MHNITHIGITHNMCAVTDEVIEGHIANLIELRLFDPDLGIQLNGQLRFFFDGNASQEEIQRSPLGSLNKVGHALHMHPVMDTNEWHLGFS